MNSLSVMRPLRKIEFRVQEGVRANFQFAIQQVAPSVNAIQKLILLSRQFVLPFWVVG